MKNIGKNNNELGITLIAQIVYDEGQENDVKALNSLEKFVEDEID